MYNLALDSGMATYGVFLLDRSARSVYRLHRSERSVYRCEALAATLAFFTAATDNDGSLLMLAQHWQ